MSTPPKRSGWYEPAVSFIIAGLFLYSGLSHLGNAYHFLGAVFEYELTSARTGEAVAMILPFIQIVTAVALLSRLFVNGALLASCCLLGVFTYVQTSAVWSGLGIDCGCFGPSINRPISIWGVYGLGGMTVATLIAYQRTLGHSLVPQSSEESK